MPRLLPLCLLLMLASACKTETPAPEKKVIHTDKAPGSIGVYSQAIQSGNRIWLSGQVALIPGTRELAGDTIEEQTHQVLKNIQAVLESAGFSLSDVVEAMVFLSDLNDYAAFNEVYVEYFPENPPARAVVEAARIPLDAKVEIKVSAVR